MKYAHLFSEVYNTPHMIHPGKAEMIEQIIRGHAMGSPPAIDAAIEYRKESSDEYKGYRITAGGVAIIPVVGTLKNRVGGLSAMSGVAGYQALAQRIESAAFDDGVKAMMLDSDTPGGAASGLYQFTDKIREMSAIKPIWSHSNESMFSAGYAIGAATNRIIGARTSEVGSIGVIAMLANQAGWNKKQGIAVHTVYAGARKNDFNPHEPVKTEALERLQVDVNKMYDLFVEHVAEGRPMTVEQIRETEAGTFNAVDGHEIGLVDDVMNFEDAVGELEASVASSSRVVSISPRKVAKTEKGVDMSVEDKDAVTFTQAEKDAAQASGVEEGLAKGAEQERTRMGAILNSDESVGREAMAKTLALDTSMAADEAVKVLAASPAVALESKVDSGSQFSAVMDGLNPDIGANAEGGADGELDDRQAAAVAVQSVFGGGG